MTSNIGADRIQEQARTGESLRPAEGRPDADPRGSFRPEFINRIDEIIVFHSLSEEQLLDITRLLLDRLGRRLHAQRIDVEFTDEAVRFLGREGFDPEYGARPLRRTIKRLVENELSRMVLSAQSSPATRSSWTWTATAAVRRRVGWSLRGGEA